MQEMSKIENCHTDASNVIPDEVPRHDGPGGE